MDIQNNEVYLDESLKEIYTQIYHKYEGVLDVAKNYTEHVIDSIHKNGKNMSDEDLSLMRKILYNSFICGVCYLDEQIS